MGSNNLTDYGEDMSGLLKLAEVLPQTKIESLGCAAAQVFAFVSAPIDTPTLSPSPILSPDRSLEGNGIGAEGASALAAILNETKITVLKCIPFSNPTWCSLSCQRPLTRLLSHRIPSCPSLAVSKATALEPRAPLRWLPSSTRRRSPSSSAPPPGSVCFPVSAR